ncbi:MAG TPA: hypothetical protein VKB93_03470 [Thermoanaerobaculia bacterium]|nr:hypothetical protein [Thermoanaerobaculia bacterium]
MKTSPAILLFLTAALSLPAQESPPHIDASPERLRKFVASIPEPPPPRPHKLTFRFGAIEFRAFGTRWRISYLPGLTPLAGTRMTTTREWPDAFALTNTAIATTPRSWHTQRQINAEMRRIEKTEMAKVRVNTD